MSTQSFRRFASLAGLVTRSLGGEEADHEAPRIACDAASNAVAPPVDPVAIRECEASIEYLTLDADHADAICRACELDEDTAPTRRA